MSAKVKWPCKFPDRWAVLPSKRLFPESKERAPESDEQLSATQEYGVISQAEFMRLAGRRVVQLNQNLELRKRVEIGDFVISMRSFQGGLERAWAEGGIRSSYVVLRPRADLVPGYYQRLFKSVDYIQALQSTANFIRDGQDMNYQNFVLIDLPFPPVSEQLCIAAFLDHETARIDALIEEQQRLIELLKEKRQAVISHAVTKGIDQTVPMKDSDVEWLGEVPAHWDVLNFNLLVYIAEGQVNPRAQPYSEMLLIAPNHVESATGRLIYTETAEEQGADSGKYVCQKGDVIYSKIRPALRKVCLAPEACLCSADMYPMRGVSGLNNEYLFWFILSEPFSAFALLESDRVAMPKINRESLGGLKLARPPLEEQKAISEFLVRETRRIDALIDEANSGVGVLNERRSALISAAVTGKIDVRGWQPPASTPAPELAVAEAH